MILYINRIDIDIYKKLRPAKGGPKKNVHGDSVVSLVKKNHLKAMCNELVRLERMGTKNLGLESVSSTSEGGLQPAAQAQCSALRDPTRAAFCRPPFPRDLIASISVW